MEWFQGTIPEAIQAARSTKGLLVVFIYDMEEPSNQSRLVLNNDSFAKELCPPRFTSIELKNGSESADQFSQIYPIVTVPSLYFISGENGIPLEVIGGPIKEDYLKSRLEKLTQHSGASASTESAPTTSDGVLTANRDSRSPVEIQSMSASAIDNENQENQEQNSTLSEEELEQKVEHARLLALELQKRKMKEQEEEERKKEIERRKIGVEMAKAQARKKEQEFEEAVRQRKKDKEEEKLAREKVKAQIAADKADREARNAALRGDASAAETSQRNYQAAPVQNSSVRIKFRFNNGSCIIGVFRTEDKISDLRSHLNSNAVLPSRYTLVSALDGTKFTDHTRSLGELGLAPSAIIIVKPVSSDSSLSPSTNWFAILWAPIAYVMTFFSRAFSYFGITGSSNESNSQNPQQRTEPSEAQNRKEPKGSYRREGNIHRLNNPNDDDEDENNTWNGNSTQQM